MMPGSNRRDTKTPQLVHLTMGEIVIPPEVLTPALMDELRRIYAAEGLDFERYVVGGPVGPDGDSLNPVTGLREYFDSAEDSVADNEAAWDGLDDDDGNETTGGGGRAEPATPPGEAPPGQAPGMEPGDLGPGLTGEYYGPSDPGDEGNGTAGRTGVSDGTPGPGGATPPGQAPGQASGQASGQALDMTPGDLGPGLTGENFGRTAPGQPGAQPDLAAPADPTRTGPAGTGQGPQNTPAPGAAPPDMVPDDLGPGLGRTPGRPPGTPGTMTPGATPAGAVDINRPGKLSTIQQSNLAAEIAGGLKASYGRAWADNLLGQLDRETAKAAGVPDAGPTRENAALLEEAEKLQKDLGPGASLGAIGAVNRGLTPGTDAFNEHARKENAMWAARDRLEVAEAPVREALRGIAKKAEVHKRAIAEFERVRRNRSATAEEKRAAQSRARAAASAVHKAVQEWEQKLGELSRVREQLRDALNGPAPTYEEVTRPNSEWVNLTSLENILHGFVATEKYVHPDGREFVFDAETKALVTDGRRGTFNFAHPREEKIRHFSEDILPHLQGR